MVGWQQFEIANYLPWQYLQELRVTDEGRENWCIIPISEEQQKSESELQGNRIKLQGRKLSLREGLLSICRTEVPQSYDDRSNPWNFNLWRTNSRKSELTDISIYRGEKLSLRGGCLSKSRTDASYKFESLENQKQSPSQSWRILVQTKKLNRGGKNIQSKHRSVRSCPILRWPIQSNPTPSGYLTIPQ
jgi:hypothetical protein